jgi:hypothetical protein
MSTGTTLLTHCVESLLNAPWPELAADSPARLLLRSQCPPGRVSRIDAPSVQAVSAA